MEEKGEKLLGLPVNDPDGCEKVAYEESYRIAMLERQRVRRLEHEIETLNQIISSQAQQIESLQHNFNV